MQMISSQLVQFNGGGTVNITGNLAMAATGAHAQTTQINFNGGGTLNVGGDITGGTNICYWCCWYQHDKCRPL